MAQRWAVQKLALAERRRDVKAGRHPRFHGWTREVTQEKSEREGRAVTMRDKPIETGEMVASYLESKNVNREPCKGIMPDGCMGRTMRKARHAPVKLWTGTDGSRQNATAAPVGKGLIVGNWAYDPTAQWAIVKR